jgi:hypothetical protein
VVACFLGGDPALIAAAGATPSATLEDAAILAVQRAGGRPARAGLATSDDADLVKAVVDRSARLAPGQRAIRGLYSGGTLAYEAALLLKDALPDADARGVHSLLDLGDDEFTVGRPHLMIDSAAHERIAARRPDNRRRAARRGSGYGSHPDPARGLCRARARQRAVRAGRELIVIGSVCGTTADPQRLPEQEARLSSAGVLLAPSNAGAARLAIAAARAADGLPSARR